MMDEPDLVLPTAQEISEMSEREGTLRLHFYVSALFLCYLVTLGLGTCIMVLGSKCLQLTRPDEFVLISHMHMKLGVSKQRILVVVVFLATYAVSLMATIYSISTKSLSQISGLDWELWLGLFVLNALSMLIQAFVAVRRLNPGRIFRLGAFAEASITGMTPVISDQFDTVKDVLFAGLCFQSNSRLLQILGISSVLYLLLIHFYFLSMDSTLGELAASHIPVVLVASTPVPQQQNSEAPPRSLGGGHGPSAVLRRRILPVLYRQTTPTRQWMLFLENFPQAVLALIFLWIQGGSLIVTTLNLLFPAAQLLLAWIFFPRLRSSVGSWLGERLGVALDDEDQLGARRLWNEANLQNDLTLLRLALPHIRPMMEAFHLQEPENLTDEQLKIIRTWWTILVEPTRTEVSFSDYDLRDANAKVMAGALHWNTTLKKLCLRNNRIGDVGCQALMVAARNSRLEELHFLELESAEKTKVFAQFAAGKLRSEQLNLRKSAVSEDVVKVLSVALKIVDHSAAVKKLDLSENDFGIEGVEALAEALKSNMTLREIYLDNNKIGRWGVEALTDALNQNTVLRKLSLIGNQVGEEATQALVTAASGGALEELHLFALQPFEYHMTDPRQALAEMLVGRFSQSELDLHFCCVQDEVVEALSMVLRSNRTVVNLRLELNQIRVAGAKALANALKENRSVQVLNLGNNAIGDEGAQVFADALEVNTTLKELMLNKNGIGVMGTQALSSAIMSNGTLQKFSLLGNEWEDHGLEVLIAAAYRSSLEELHLFQLEKKEQNEAFAQFLAGHFRGNELNLDRSGLTDTAAKALGFAVKLNDTMKKVYLRHNDLTAKGVEVIESALALKKRRTSLMSLPSHLSHLTPRVTKTPVAILK